MNQAHAVLAYMSNKQRFDELIASEKAGREPLGSTATPSESRVLQYIERQTLQLFDQCAFQVAQPLNENS